MAFTFCLGFLSAAIIFLVVIAIPALGYRLARMNPVLAFRFAYVITRALGASLADWMGFPRSYGALGWGHGAVSLGFTVLIVAGVALLTATRVDAPTA